MDIRERIENPLYRHPWELSRTECVTGECSRYLQKKTNKTYINVGAGDLFFDDYLLDRFKNTGVIAVDIAYTQALKELLLSDLRNADRMCMKSSLEELGGVCADFAVMMDSLEYMEDDLAYVRALTELVAESGYLFFTLPAFQFLFSAHDEHVGNLRRYSKKDFASLIAGIRELEIVRMHYFYTFLFFFRLLLKVLHLKVDPEIKRTVGWKFSERNFVTVILRKALNADYRMNRYLAQKDLSLPGLSLFAVCRKRSTNSEE